MMAAILPDNVRVIEGPIPTVSGGLLPEEAAALGCVSRSRRLEFTAARVYARRALASLGVPPLPLLRGPDRQPLWPAGIVGSITHCATYCAVAVAPSTMFQSIGIDAEPNQPLPDDVLAYIALAPERAWLAAHRHPTICWDRLLFSAKESAFKAWFAVTQQWLDFSDAAVNIHPESQRFDVRIHPPDRPSRGRSSFEWSGRYCITDGNVLTSIISLSVADVTAQRQRRNAP